MVRSLKIAVADDERDIRDYLTRMLPRLGHQVVCAAGSGRELVEHCVSAPPDLIITDVRMPELGGIPAVEEIWRDQPLPVIFLSARDLPEELNADSSEHPRVVSLLKPIGRPQLEAAIEQAFSVSDAAVCS